MRGEVIKESWGGNTHTHHTHTCVWCVCVSEWMCVYLYLYIFSGEQSKRERNGVKKRFSFLRSEIFVCSFMAMTRGRGENWWFRTKRKELLGGWWEPTDWAAVVEVEAEWVLQSSSEWHSIDRDWAAKCTDGLQMAPGSNFQAVCSISRRNNLSGTWYCGCSLGIWVPKEQNTTQYRAAGNQKKYESSSMDSKVKCHFNCD